MQTDTFCLDCHNTGVRNTPKDSMMVYDPCYCECQEGQKRRRTAIVFRLTMWLALITLLLAGNCFCGE